MKSWKEIIIPFMKSEKGEYIRNFVSQRRKEVTVYPSQENVMRAFRDETCPIEKVRIVIVGQDPYHNGMADGLAFSSLDSKRPESLKNIFKELHKDLYSYMKEETWDRFMPTSRLDNWAKQGVLLMNTVLTVEEGNPGSHGKIGWQDFTSEVIQKISESEEDKPVVFMLWGKYAQTLKPLIKKRHHLVLEAAHPSPFSADKGFFGCKHFSKAQTFLKENRSTENLTVKVDMRPFIQIDKILQATKDMIVKNEIPIKEPNQMLKELFNLLTNDYFWDLEYPINYSTKM